ncbi:diguanylate cyclase, partial [Candidatus Uhrbacteria bacterium]|nr:diguanylate cyclase [Candidatus Uhrbacteria bacterium]
LTVVVTRPVRRLARAAQAVAERRYDAETSLPTDRTPGTPVRDEVNQLEEGFHLMTKVIHGHEQELRRLVLIDETTGAYNVQHFRAQLPVERSKGRRYGHPTSLLIVDLDGMDTACVAERDRIAIRTTAYLVRSLRRVDTIFRLAADRFVAILPETPEVGAAVAAERLRTFASDVTAGSEPPVVLRVASVGWTAEAQDDVDDVVARLTEKGDSAA